MFLILQADIPFLTTFNDIKKIIDTNISNTRDEGIRKSLIQFPR